MVINNVQGKVCECYLKLKMSCWCVACTRYSRVSFDDQSFKRMLTFLDEAQSLVFYGSVSLP